MMSSAAAVPPIRHEFLGSHLGDARLDRRLIRVGERIDANPTASLPALMGSESELEGLYRFASNEDVHWNRVLDPHVDRTWKRISGRQRVLVAHDTSQMVFSGVVGKTGLTRFGVERQGFFAHVALAISADGERRPLGVLGVLPVIRENAVEVPLAEDEVDDYVYANESQRWAELVDLVEDERPEGVQVVHVMDREGDQYPLLAQMNELGTDYVVRRCHDRRLAGQPGYLSDVEARAPLMLTRSVFISRRGAGRKRRPKDEKTHPSRDERIAQLEVRAMALEVRRPDGAPTDVAAKLALNVVYVTEPNPPDGCAPVHWVLLTSLPIDTAEQVAEVVDSYRARWLIEEFFKSLKTGCAYEKRQLESLDALLVMLAITIPVAWRLLALRWASRSRPNAPASEVLTDLQVRILRRADPKKRGVPSRPTVQHVTMAIARLGGHQKSNGEPGWQVLGRGMRRLMDLVEGAMLVLGLASNSAFDAEGSEM